MSHFTPLARSTGPVTPSATASSAEITPTFFVRSSQMRLVVSSSSYSSIFGRTNVHEILHFLFKARVGLVLAAADAEGMRRQARAAVLLERS